MRGKLNRGRHRKALRRIRELHSQSRTPVAENLNVYLTTLMSVAMLLLAFAQYKTAEKQTEIADALAALEFAKAKAKFSVSASANTSAIMQDGRRLDPQIPATISVLPVEGVQDIFGTSGQATLVITDRSAADELCMVAIRGLFSEERRDRIRLDRAPLGELQGLVEAADYEGLTARGFFTEVQVSYVDLFGTPSIANLSKDGADLEHSSVKDTDVIRIYAGAWSGGEGFYFDGGTAPEEACPSIGSKLRKLVAATNGKAGNRYDNLPPEQRRELRLP